MFYGKSGPEHQLKVDSQSIRPCTIITSASKLYAAGQTLIAKLSLT
jgi:hypothetical protein